nr:MAG TPA: hypothetical protein [Caudoviricetes sp.]
MVKPAGPSSVSLRKNSSTQPILYDWPPDGN